MGGGHSCSSSPHVSARSGNFSFLFLLSGVSSPSLFLGGDLATPLSKFMVFRISWILLAFTLSPSQFLISSSTWGAVSSPLASSCLLSCSLSSPSVSLPILERLNSDLEFKTTSSPNFSILTASAICLPRADWKNLTGLKWNLGLSLPLWWSTWCFRMWESSWPAL